MKKVGLGFALLLVIVLGCKKEITKPNSGIYRGVYYKIGTVSGDSIDISCTIALNDEKSSFSFAVDSGFGIPYDCAGEFEIIDDEIIKFKTTSFKSSTANPIYFLDTTYTYLFNGKRLELKKTYGNYEHQYLFNRY